MKEKKQDEAAKVTVTRFDAQGTIIAADGLDAKQGTAETIELGDLVEEVTAALNEANAPQSRGALAKEMNKQEAAAVAAFDKILEGYADLAAIDQRLVRVNTRRISAQFANNHERPIKALKIRLQRGY